MRMILIRLQVIQYTAVWNSAAASITDVMQLKETFDVETETQNANEDAKYDEEVLLNYNRKLQILRTLYVNFETHRKAEYILITLDKSVLNNIDVTIDVTDTYDNNSTPTTHLIHPDIASSYSRASSTLF